jgi:hypothetical protein
MQAAEQSQSASAATDVRTKKFPNVKSFGILRFMNASLAKNCQSNSV